MYVVLVTLLFHVVTVSTIKNTYTQSKITDSETFIWKWLITVVS